MGCKGKLVALLFGQACLIIYVRFWHKADILL